MTIRWRISKGKEVTPSQITREQWERVIECYNENFSM